MSAEWKAIGVVRSVSVFPVKAMSASALPACKIGWQGLDGDRRWALLRLGSQSGLPWASARRFPQLSRVQCRHQDGATVFGIDGDEIAVDDPDAATLLSKIVGEPVKPFELWRGTFDAMPISVITTEAIASLADAVGAHLDERRFRSNIVVETATGRAFPEEKWVGGELRIGDEKGDPRLRVDRKTERCNVIDVDPDTGVADVAAFAKIAEVRRKNLGVYGSVVRPGLIQQGATLWVKN